MKFYKKNFFLSYLLKFRLPDLFIIGLFIIYAYFIFFGLKDRELRGDEASSLLAIIPAMKFNLNPKYLASIFLFGHVPIRAIVEIPFIYLFGLKEFWLSLPNVLASLIFFTVIYKLLKNNNNFGGIIIGLGFLSFNANIFLQRQVMGVAFFLLWSTYLVYYLDLYLKTNKTNHLKKAIIFMLFSILTYEEGLFFIPVAIYWLIKKKKLNFNAYKLLTIYLLIPLLIYMFFWLLIPFLAYQNGMIGNLDDFGAFRIIKRMSGGGFNINPGHLWQMLVSYNSFLFALLLFLGIIFAFFNKKLVYYWSFFLPGLIYFSVIKMPTEHIFNYMNFIIILSAYGWIYLLSRLKIRISYLGKLIFFLIFWWSLYLNWQKITFIKHPHNFGLKATAYLIRERTSVCDKIYTQIEGHVARLYFGRRYTLNPREAKVIILEKDIQENIDNKLLFNQKYSSFQELMPYLLCQN